MSLRTKFGFFSVASSRCPCLWGPSLLISETTLTTFVVWPPPCIGGNKARGISVGSLIVKTAGSSPGEACRKAHRRPICVWGRLEAIHGVTRPRAWPLRGAPTRTRGKLMRFCTSVKIPESSTGVCMSLPYSLDSAFT